MESGLDEHGGVEVVEEFPQPGVGGHGLEYFSEERPDERIRIRHKQQDRAGSFPE